MTGNISCIWCLMPGGPGRDKRGQVFADREAYYNHVEMEHDVPVKRPGETQEQTLERFLAKNTRSGGPDCGCPKCNNNVGLVGLLTTLPGGTCGDGHA